MQIKEADTYEGVPGTKETFVIRMGEMPNGMPYYLPVMVVNGASEGPEFFVNAAMHGDEILGTEAVRQAWKVIDPQEMRGRLVMIPMANLSGVGTRTRRNIVEMYPGPHDMNRVFPGKADGIMTERIAHTIIERFVKPADYTFDVHCASVGGEWLAYTAMPAEDDDLDPAVIKESRELAPAFGARLILEGLMIEGSLVREALNLGKVAGMVEFGVANSSSRPERIWGRTGILNLLTHVGMLDGEVPTVEGQFVTRSMTRILTDRGGFLHRRVETGQDVAEGDNLAVLMSLEGEELHNFDAPHDGVVSRMNTMGVVGTGDIVAFVARRA